jgi:hypothetical protein
VSLAGSLGGASGDECGWRAVRGSDLRAMFPGREFGDGIHFAYRFRRDGSFSGTEIGRSVAGRWRTTSKQFCWSWTRPPGAEECYDVQRNGSDIRFLSNGSEAFFGKLTPARSP